MSEQYEKLVFANNLRRILESKGIEQNPGGSHTFATLWHEQRLNEGIRRYIQGHAQQGVGEQVYTHYDIDVIREELNRLKV